MLTFVVHGVVSKVDVVHWRYNLQCAYLFSSKNIVKNHFNVQNQYLASKLELAYALALCQKKKHG